jgi:hypothetical protein
MHFAHKTAPVIALGVDTLALMVTAPTVRELYKSAAKFARSALDAHHEGDHQRVALDAGTSLEHLTKACLAKRSPALLVELRTGNWVSLTVLCGLSQPGLKHLRTVGLREACERVKTFVTSPAPKDDLDLLINLRDGVVHAAVNDQVEEQLLVAYALQADSILADMKVPRSTFWGAHQEDVDALLGDASDKVAERVKMKLAAAKATLEKKYGVMTDEMLKAIWGITPRIDAMLESTAPCVVCGSDGVAEGEIWLDEALDNETGSVYGGLRFTPTTFACQQCELRLTSPKEMLAAGMPTDWEHTDLDFSDYVSYLEDVEAARREAE